LRQKKEELMEQRESIHDQGWDTNVQKAAKAKAVARQEGRKGPPSYPELLAPVLASRRAVACGPPRLAPA